MISPAAAELLRRGREQIRSGIECDLRDEYEMARVWFHAALASLDALQALLDAPDHRPMRKLAIVGKANDNGGDGAA